MNRFKMNWIIQKFCVRNLKKSSSSLGKITTVRSTITICTGTNVAVFVFNTMFPPWKGRDIVCVAIYMLGTPEGRARQTSGWLGFPAVAICNRMNPGHIENLLGFSGLGGRPPAQQQAIVIVSMTCETCEEGIAPNSSNTSSRYRYHGRREVVAELTPCQ